MRAYYQLEDGIRDHPSYFTPLSYHDRGGRILRNKVLPTGLSGRRAGLRNFVTVRPTLVQPCHQPEHALSDFSLAFILWLYNLSGKLQLHNR